MELMHYSLLLITLLLPITVARRINDLRPALGLWISVACAIACYCLVFIMDIAGIIALLLAEIAYGLLAILFSKRSGRGLVVLSLRCGLLAAIASGHSYCLMVFAVWFGNESLSNYPVFTSPPVIAMTATIFLSSIFALAALLWTALQECKVSICSPEAIASD